MLQIISCFPTLLNGICIWFKLISKAVVQQYYKNNTFLFKRNKFSEKRPPDSLTGRVYKGHPCFYISYWTTMSRCNRTIITILQLLCIISYSLSKPASRLQSSGKAVVVEGGKLQQVIDTQMSVEPQRYRRQLSEDEHVFKLHQLLLKVNAFHFESVRLGWRTVLPSNS